MKINDFEIGKKAFVIAEIGSNHNGDFETAKKLIERAAECKVDAVKFQTYRAKKLIIKGAETLAHVSGEHKTQFERLESLEFALEEWTELSEIAKKRGLIFLSTPFDRESADFLDTLVPAFKISSGDLTNLPLIRHVIKKRKPIILSTGLSNTDEIEKIINEVPKENLILLHCVASYPTPLEELNLNSIPFLKEKFEVPVGYSDHSIGTLACKIAVALGACIVEKHFTLDKNQEIGDHKLSADPEDMKELIKEIEMNNDLDKIEVEKDLLEKILGNYEKRPAPSEFSMIEKMRRSLYAAQDIKAGTVLEGNMLIPLRPAKGISPMEIDSVVGKKVKTDLKEGDVLSEDALE